VPVSLRAPIKISTPIAVRNARTALSTAPAAIDHVALVRRLLTACYQCDKSPAIRLYLRDPSGRAYIPGVICPPRGPSRNRGHAPLVRPFAGHGWVSWNSCLTKPDRYSLAEVEPSRTTQTANTAAMSTAVGIG
jgi:hypothetical protein